MGAKAGSWEASSGRWGGGRVLAEVPSDFCDPSLSEQRYWFWEF